MVKKFLGFLLGINFLIFGSGIILADCVDIDVPPSGKSYSFCIEKLGSSKFKMSVVDAEEVYGCSITSISMNGGSNSNWVFNSCGIQKGEFTISPSSGLRDFNLKLRYNGKEYSKRIFYDLDDGVFIERDKNGKPVSENEDNNTENNNTDNNTENNNTDNNTVNNNTENNNTENNNTENNNTENTETVKKNTTLNLITNDKSLDVKQYINLTIETDKNYVGKLTFSTKYRNSSSSSWSSISRTSSTYFSDYSDEWYNGYYKMKSSDDGDVTLKNLVKFNKGGDYRIYVEDIDGNEKYLTFSVYEENEDLSKDANTNSIKSEDSEKNKENTVTNKYDNVVVYNDALGSSIDKCYTAVNNAIYYFYSGTLDELEKSINSTITTCNGVVSDLEGIGGWDGDKSYVDGAKSVIKKIIEYYEVYKKLFPFFRMEDDNITETDIKEYNSIVNELNNIDADVALLENNLYFIQDRFARRQGYYVIPCSIEGTKYSNELTTAYEWACLNGITTISDINSAGLDQPLTRAQLAKMMSLFKYNILQEKPQAKPQITYNDVSSNLGDLEGYIQIAYDYGIMGVDKNGNAIESFNPNGTLNRGDFGTVFSRTLWGDRYNKDGGDYYTNHLNALKNGGYMNNINPKLLEIRGYVMLMMYRAAQSISNEATSWTSLNSTTNKVTTSNNTNSTNTVNKSTSTTSSSNTSTSRTYEESAAAARGKVTGASAGAIRAQQNEAYNRAVAGVDTSSCGSYNPYGGQSYGARLNNCQNKTSNSKTSNSKNSYSNNNSYSNIYDALSNYIKSTNGIDTNEYRKFSNQKKTSDDYLGDLIGVINGSTNMYIPHSNFGQNNKSKVNSVINALNTLNGGYTPHVNFSIY